MKHIAKAQKNILTKLLKNASFLLAFAVVASASGLFFPNLQSNSVDKYLSENSVSVWTYKTSIENSSEVSHQFAAFTKNTTGKVQPADQEPTAFMCSFSNANGTQTNLQGSESAQVLNCLSDQLALSVTTEKAGQNLSVRNLEPQPKILVTRVNLASSSLRVAFSSNNSQDASPAVVQTLGLTASAVSEQKQHLSFALASFNLRNSESISEAGDTQALLQVFRC